MAPKSAKKPSKPSRKPSPSTPESSQSPLNDEDLSHSLLQRASLQYPSLISTSAFIGRISEVESKRSGHAAVIWLSQTAMVTSSLFPHSLVSISLPASSKQLFNDSSPLDSLADECSNHFSIDVSSNMVSSVGSFFALAEVLPSSKVLKNGARLSWSLSCTMGGPAMGRIIFISLVKNQSIACPLNGINEVHDSTNEEVSGLSLYKCKDLHLKLVPSYHGQTVSSDMSSSFDIPAETVCDVSSPKTPSPYQSKVTSPSVSQPHLSSFRESALSVDWLDGTSFNISAIRMELEDEKARRLWEIGSACWLCSRSLLHGNLVALPLGTRTGFFCVEDANKLSVESSFQNSVQEGKLSLLPHEIQTPNSVGHVVAAFLVDSSTKVHLLSPMPLVTGTQDKGGSLLVEDEEAFSISKLGGLSKEFAELKEIIVDKIQRHAKYTGVLLHGPPGTGKTSLACSCVHDAGVKLFSVNGPEIITEDYGKSEQELHQIFDKARRAAPAVVFIDELDAIAPARKDGGEHLSQRMVVTLLKLMDEIRISSVLVIAATNRPDSIDSALRRHGRFDREIEIGVPSREQRLDILVNLLSEMDHSLVDAQVRSLASTTHGFVGADLAALCNKAALTALRRYIKMKNPNKFPATHNQQYMEQCLRFDSFEDVMGRSDMVKVEGVSSTDHVDSTMLLLSNLTISSGPPHSSGCCDIAPESINSLQDAVYIDNGKEYCVMEQEPLLKVTFDDFEKAKMEVRPSAMREVMIEVPNVSWEDVGGQDEVKRQLIEAVEWPQKHQDAFERVGIRPPTGVLMFGPPGCSKTLMARAVASNAKLNFIAVKGPELFSKWVGESEKAVRSLFAKARAAAPSIIFFDEIDGLAVTRGQENDGVSVADRVMTQLLVELDGLKQRVDVTVIAATNRPDKIDSALLRPGRFDRLLYVGPPNEADREDIFRIHLRKMPCSSNVCIRELAHLTEGCTGADISSICREAALAALEESLDIAEISMAHFKAAIGRVPPSEFQSYEELSAKFQRKFMTSIIHFFEAHSIVHSFSTGSGTMRSSDVNKGETGGTSITHLLLIGKLSIPWKDSHRHDGSGLSDGVSTLLDFSLMDALDVIPVCHAGKCGERVCMCVGFAKLFSLSAGIYINKGGNKRMLAHLYMIGTLLSIEMVTPWEILLACQCS